MENFAFLFLNLQQHGTSKHVVTDIMTTRQALYGISMPKPNDGSKDLGLGPNTDGYTKGFNMAWTSSNGKITHIKIQFFYN